MSQYSLFSNEKEDGSLESSEKQLKNLNLKNNDNKEEEEKKDGKKKESGMADKEGFCMINWDQKVESFDDMGLSRSLLRGIYAIGFENPSAIQKRAILPLISGKDTIAQAQSGTGKTGTFSIGSLQKIDGDLKELQVLILAPTRELANQTYGVVRNLSTYMVDITVHMCIGGTSVRQDTETLRNGGIQIVIGTPGRVMDMLDRGHLSVKHLKLFILDEADEMLSRGFKDKMYETFQYLPPDVQIGLFSATLPLDILTLSKAFMRNPVEILVKKEEITLAGIKQYFVNLELEKHKLDTLLDIYDSVNITQAIIFCNTKNKVKWLSDQMIRNDFTVGCIHGDLDASSRKLIMKEFRAGTTRVLISTNLLARGIDVYNVSLVINYDLPLDKENYIHRIGRAGRFGRKGVTINFVTDGEQEQQMKALEEFYATKMISLPMDLANLYQHD